VDYSARPSQPGAKRLTWRLCPSLVSYLCDDGSQLEQSCEVNVGILCLVVPGSDVVQDERVVERCERFVRDVGAGRHAVRLDVVEQIVFYKHGGRSESLVTVSGRSGRMHR
jgi:hypothetical protein